MEIELLAADSMGTRSMATFVRTPDVSILIDPGVALGPRRYGLPPHPVEIERLHQHWERILKAAQQADIFIITHYHYDHHNPDHVEIFEGKEVYIKHPLENINRSQRGRASFFRERLGELPSKVEFAEGKTLRFGRTTVVFSDSVFHGTNSRLGHVVEVFIESPDGTFLFSSDVEGPAVEEQVRFILEHPAEIIYIDGPMTYMLGYRYSAKHLERSIENLIRIIEEVRPKVMILDHHLLRDLHWRERMAPVFDAGEGNGVKVVCAAEFMGEPVEQLEARRKELYGRK